MAQCCENLTDAVMSALDRLGIITDGPSRLAGGLIGDYSFSKPLFRGKQIQLRDMAIYTMVKNATFNGINLSAIACWNTPLTN